MRRSTPFPRRENIKRLSQFFSARAFYYCIKGENSTLPFIREWNLQCYTEISSEEIVFIILGAHLRHDTPNARAIVLDDFNIAIFIGVTATVPRELRHHLSACFLSYNPTPNRFSRQRRLSELLQRRFPLSQEKCQKKQEDGRKKSSVRKTHSPSKPSTPSYWALLAERNIFCFRKSRFRKWTDSSS